MEKNELQRRTFRGEISNANLKTGVVDALIPMSTGSEDRMGEVILPSAFKKHLKEFMKHPVMVSSHDYWSLLNQIGYFTELEVTDQGLMGKPCYYIGMGNPEADWAFVLATLNMAAFSVGFIPIKSSLGDREKGEPWEIYEEVELLEISQVVVPANREAIQSLKSEHPDQYAQLQPVVKQLMEEAVKEKNLWLGIEISDDPAVAPLVHLESYGVKKEELETKGKNLWLGDDPVVKQLMEEAVMEPIEKVEETEDYIRVPNPKDDGDHKGHDVKTIDIDKDKGIKALYCVDDKVVMTYLFSKEEGWILSSAKEWVEEHSKSLEGWWESDSGYFGAGQTLNYPDWLSIYGLGVEEGVGVIRQKLAEDKPISQDELMDEMSFLAENLAVVGLNEEAHRHGHELLRLIMRDLGNDIPIDIVQMAGALLSDKTRADITTIAGLLDGVIKRSNLEEPEPIPDKEQLAEAVKAVLTGMEEETDTAQVARKEEIKQAVSEVIDELRGVVK
ncbi:hypothetical protein CMI37_13850 [Candidatus Pacearchaeota archaeon]|nr:hypothetical protein [Candidatus Pacearchaeota archaeon]|tara:strand:- start:2269 stop:3774 length:1506 start_codon:yes stop_codon:yes gene_type:complete